MAFRAGAARSCSATWPKKAPSPSTASASPSRAGSDGIADIAIIPFTYEHTNVRSMAAGDAVNLEVRHPGEICRKLARQRGSLTQPLGSRSRNSSTRASSPRKRVRRPRDIFPRAAPVKNQTNQAPRSTVPPISLDSNIHLFEDSPGGIRDSAIPTSTTRNPSEPASQTPNFPPGISTAFGCAPRSFR